MILGYGWTGTIQNFNPQLLSRCTRSDFRLVLLDTVQGISILSSRISEFGSSIPSR